MEKSIRTTLVVSKSLLKELQDVAQKEGMILERYVEKVIRIGMEASQSEFLWVVTQQTP